MYRIAVLAGTLIALVQSARADFEAGFTSFQRGDFESAEAELAPVAGQGDPRAQYVLGIMYLNGFGVPLDPPVAADWMRQAAENGYLDAQVELARMYRVGDGVEQDFAQMALWYRRAAEQGDVGAQLFLADTYAYGQGVEIDYVQAYMWYEIAIKYWGPLAVHARDVVAEKMTPDQIVTALEMAEKWWRETVRRRSESGN